MVQPKYNPEKGRSIPFTQTIDLTSTTSTNAGATIATIPVYDTVWIELVLDCATKGVTVTIDPDTTGGNLGTMSVALTAGTTGNKMWHLVNGVPQNVGVAYGSHVVVLKATSTVGGDHGVITGYAVLHGMRRT
jgi:hypothetical protein